MFTELIAKRRRWVGLLAAVAGVAGMTGLIHAIPGASGIANVSMLYLIVVISTALWFGRAAAVLASLLAFLAFDFFFTQPQRTLTVHDPAEWLALLMFLLTAAVTGQLTATARSQAEEARRREKETAALSEASWAVASQVDRERALAEVLRHVTRVIPVESCGILTREAPDSIRVAATWPPDRSPPGSVLEASRLNWEQEAKSTRGNGVVASPSMADAPHWILPLSIEQRVLGALYIVVRRPHLVSPAEWRVVESLANLAAVVLERDRLAGAEARGQALAEADRLKTALLSMVSHDFRSPLASIKASATACLQHAGASEPGAQLDLHQGIIQEADRLNGIVANILALSRLEADAWRPQREEAALEEVIEAARAGLSRENNQRVDVSYDRSHEDVWLDPVQIGQVLHNLLDNALKYSPAATRVELRIEAEGDRLLFDVLDRGPGLPRGEEERVFERFYRAPALRESAVPGVGIGLSVCRGLVEAHGGDLTARNREGGGAAFRIALPLGGRE